MIGINDISGTVYNPNGIDFKLLQSIKEEKRLLVKDYALQDAGCTFTTNPKELWRIPCDIVLPCATQNEIDLEDAKALVANNVICVCEGANMPCTLEATEYFIENKIMFGPAKAANAGGVMVSGFEMSQNSMRYAWTFEEVEAKLKQQMENIFVEVYDCAKHYGNEYNTVSYIPWRPY